MDLQTWPFKTRPYSHQYHLIDNSWRLPEFALHLEMGLGKSRIVIDSLAVSYMEQNLTHALIVAPAGVYQNWYLEFDKHCPNHVPRSVYTWRRLSTKREKEAFKEFVLNEDESLKVFLINVEALSTGNGYKAAELFLRKVPGAAAMIVDESTAIKSHKAKRTKNAIKLGKLCTYRRVLSGLPNPNSPMDVYAPFSFLSGNGPHLLGYENYYAFQARYCIEKLMRVGSQKSFKTVVGYRRLDELQQRIDKHAARLKKVDCLDLPEKIYIKRDSPLTAEQKTLYNSLKQSFLTEYKDEEISTTIMLTKLLRFQQIITGHITTDTGKVEVVPHHRIKTLLETINEVSGKVVIWANFRHCIQEIESALVREYGETSVASFYGDTTRSERVEIVRNFQNPNHELRFLVGNPSTAGYGITLTESNTAIYYSRDFRLDNRMQSEDRIHRIGQKKANVVYIDIVSPDTIDEKIVNALRNKMELSAKVLGEVAPDWL